MYILPNLSNTLMALMLWLLLALGAVFAVVWRFTNGARRHLPPLLLAPGESVPSTPLQRSARTTLVLMLLCTVAAVAALVAKGAQAFWDEEAVRLPVTGLVMAALTAFAAFMLRVSLWTKSDDGQLDERDQAILATASAGQAPAIILVLAAWMIGLGEGFRETRLIPTVYLYLIFWTCLLVSLHAQLVGILVGYRRQ